MAWNHPLEEFKATAVPQQPLRTAHPRGEWYDPAGCTETVGAGNT
jgi:hypothetical protein